MTRVFDEDLDAGLATRAVHAGQRPDPATGAIMTPVYLTSTYAQEGLGQNKGYEYARGRNPTREALERIPSGPKMCSARYPSNVSPLATSTILARRC